jgi:hypothetical protein
MLEKERDSIKSIQPASIDDIRKFYLKKKID